jgi:hypothetical protein
MFHKGIQESARLRKLIPQQEQKDRWAESGQPMESVLCPSDSSSSPGDAIGLSKTIGNCSLLFSYSFRSGFHFPVQCLRPRVR